MKTSIEIIEDVADAIGGEVYPDYSGRGMFGSTCYGIVFAGNTTRVIEEASARGLRGAKTDSMGKDCIVYWPHVKADDNSET